MNRLTVNKITSIGAVEAPDNEESTVLLFKSKPIEPEPGPIVKEGSMPFDIDSLTDEGKAHVAGLEARIAELSEEPAVLPDDLPDVVKSRLAESDEAIAKMQADNERVSKENAALRDEMATEKYAARAEALAVLLGDPADVAPVLKALAASDPEAFGKLDAMFDTLIVKDVMAPLFKEIGDSASEGSAVDQITAFATEIRKNSPDMTLVAARAQAWTEHPELKTQSREES